MNRAMRQMRWRDDSGMSITELMVVVVLMGFVLAAAWSIMYAASAASGSLSARSVATDESQTFIDTITRELRQASNLKSLGRSDTNDAAAKAAFSEIAARQTTFYADLMHNGHPSKVQYLLTGSTLYRKEWVATNTTYPFTWPASPTKTKVMIETVDPAWADSIFIYYTNDSLPPTQITSASKVESVTAVMVQVKNRQVWDNRSSSYGASSTVRVRAMGNSF